jgi:hypothetical protein
MIRGDGTAVSLQLIMVGTRHCRLLISNNYSDATEIDIAVGTRHCRLLISTGFDIISKDGDPREFSQL